MGFRHLFVTFDLFGVNPSLYFHQQNAIKTLLGSILSMFIFIFTVSLTIYFSLDLFYRRNPTLNIYKDYTIERKPLNITNFLYALVLKDSKGNNIDLSNEFWLTFLIIQNTSSILVKNQTEKEEEGEDEKDQDRFFEKGEEPDNLKELSFVHCKEEYLKDFTNTEDKVKQYIINNGLCLNPNNTILTGSPLYNVNSKYFQFFLAYNTTMFSDEYMKYKVYFPMSIQIFYQSVIYDPSNFDNPFIKEIGVINSQNLGYEFYEDKAFISLYSSERDDNFFLSKINKTQIFGLNSYSHTYFDTFDDYYAHTTSLLRMEIILEHFHEVYNRRYLKIQDLFAKVSGLVNVALVAIHIILSLFKDNEVVNSIIRSHYGTSFSHLIHKTSKMKHSTFLNKGASSLFSLHNIQHESTVDKLCIMKKNSNQNLMTKVQNTSECEKGGNSSPKFFKNEKTNIIVPNNEKLKYELSNGKFSKQTSKSKGISSFCFSKKKQYWIKERQRLRNILDIDNYLTIYEELQIMKLLLFSNEQINSFQFIDKINLYNDNLNARQGKQKEILKEITLYYKKNFLSNTLSKTDKMLLELINFKIRNEIISNFNN